MGTRSSTRKRAGHSTPPGSPSRPPDITELRRKQTADFRRALDADFAHPLFAGVYEGHDFELAEAEAELSEDGRGCVPKCATVAVLRLQRHAEPVPGGTEQAFRSTLRDPARQRAHQPGVGRERPAH